MRVFAQRHRISLGEECNRGLNEARLPTVEVPYCPVRLTNKTHKKWWKLDSKTDDPKNQERIHSGKVRNEKIKNVFQDFM